MQKFWNSQAQLIGPKRCQTHFRSGAGWVEGDFIYLTCIYFIRAYLKWDFSFKYITQPTSNVLFITFIFICKFLTEVKVELLSELIQLVRKEQAKLISSVA